MGPLAPEVYRARSHRTTAADAETALAELRRMFVTQVAAEQVAAIIVEPVQGEGGFLPAPQAFLEGLRAICDEHGICLIADEVQTGFARTGKLFASSTGRRARPDHPREVDRRRLPALGRARQGRPPRRGARRRRRRRFVGNPVAQAAALAVLDVIDEEGSASARPPSARRCRRMLAGRRFPAIGDVRGLGAMLAIELVADPATKSRRRS